MKSFDLIAGAGLYVTTGTSFLDSALDILFFQDFIVWTPLLVMKTIFFAFELLRAMLSLPWNLDPKWYNEGNLSMFKRIVILCALTLFSVSFHLEILLQFF